jgi:hypothetical protein
MGRLRGVGCSKVIEGFFTVPYSRHVEAELADGLEGYLLVYGADLS